MNNPKRSNLGYIIKYYYEYLQHQTEEQPEQTLEEWKLVRLAVIRAAFNDLPRDEKRVIMLSYFYNLSERAISEKTGIPKSTVNRIKQNACAKLSKKVSLWFLIASAKSDGDSPFSRDEAQPLDREALHAMQDTIQPRPQPQWP